jgi:hypothetical protein
VFAAPFAFTTSGFGQGARFVALQQHLLLHDKPQYEAAGHEAILEFPVHAPAFLAAENSLENELPPESQ